MTRIALANLTELPFLLTSIGENPHNFDYDDVLKENFIQTLVYQSNFQSS
jgi:hypothetical protein